MYVEDTCADQPQNWVHDTDDFGGVRRSAIQERATKELRHEAETSGPATDLSCQSWNLSNEEHIPDFYVRDIPAGICRSRFPTGLDKGALTYALEYLLDHPDEWPDLRVTQLEQFVRNKGFDRHDPVISPGGEHPDKEALKRWKRPLTKYRVTYAGDAVKAAKAAR